MFKTNSNGYQIPGAALPMYNNVVAQKSSTIAPTYNSRYNSKTIA
jgi:hypothetical protein